jgi:hypothetical protein
MYMPDLQEYRTDTVAAEPDAAFDDASEHPDAPLCQLCQDYVDVMRKLTRLREGAEPAGDTMPDEFALNGQRRRMERIISRTRAQTMWGFYAKAVCAYCDVVLDRLEGQSGLASAGVQYTLADRIVESLVGDLMAQKPSG